MNKTVYAFVLVVALFVSGSAQAVPPITNVLSFINMNAEDGSTTNSLQIAGGTNGLSIVRSTVDNNRLYSITYANVDYDGDTINDLLTFDVLLEGYSNGSITNGGLTNSTAIIGTTDANVVVWDDRGFSVGSIYMEINRSLKCSITNIVVNHLVPGSIEITSVGFDQVLCIENEPSYGHETVVGEGTGAQGYPSYNTNKSIDMNPVHHPLYVSSPVGTSGSQPSHWCIGHVDFNITVIYRPPSATVIMME